MQGTLQDPWAKEGIPWLELVPPFIPLLPTATWDTPHPTGLEVAQATMVVEDQVDPDTQDLVALGVVVVASGHQDHLLEAMEVQGSMVVHQALQDQVVSAPPMVLVVVVVVAHHTMVVVEVLLLSMVVVVVAHPHTLVPPLVVAVEMVVGMAECLKPRSGWSGTS